jgi:hypothetical protein
MNPVITTPEETPDASLFSIKDAFEVEIEKEVQPTSAKPA